LVADEVFAARPYPEAAVGRSVFDPDNPPMFVVRQGEEFNRPEDRADQTNPKIASSLNAIQ